MENTRVLLVSILLFLLYLLWQAWQEDYGFLRPPEIQQAEVKDSKTASPDDVPVQNKAETDKSVEEVVETPVGSGTPIRVKTDVFDITINTQGGIIEKAMLPKYPVSIKELDKPIVLLDDSKALTYLVQSGIISQTDKFDHRNAAYQSEQTSYTMADGQDSLEVKLQLTGADGLTISKIYTFKRGNYLVDLRYEIENQRSVEWKGNVYGQLQRSRNDEKVGYVPTYVGAAFSTPEKRYEKITFDDMVSQPLSQNVKGGWIAMVQHYFFTAIIPDKLDQYHYYSTAFPDKNRYVIGMTSPEVKVAPGQKVSSGFQVYLGPKAQKVVQEIAPNLDLTVDYGRLWFIAKPIFWLLDKLHSLVGNWGMAIILVTVVIKGLFYYPSAISYKSMAKLRMVHPQLTALRERYADDKMRLNQAMMELYKKEKINPFGGCLPMLIQIPVFIALYWVLFETVELRQAPFVLWLKDLSIQDPFYVLPIIMGISMYVQQKLSPPAADPLQQKMFQILPIAMAGSFAFFPAGLVLYWCVSNILSIIQQWYITKRFGEPAKAKAKA